ncbi:MAG TPA: glycosyltransferase family 2 protein [Bacteroidaceae bacterium]|nr:glycosyltransferase family 2 protein [Bacteroidaceae bacterium]
MISIITPVFNSEKYITRYLKSIMAQTMTDLEIIIVDDHGADNSIEKAREIVNKYKGPISFKFLKTACNSGPGVARNIGIEAAQGDYLAFVDSDDTIHREFCSLLLESAKLNKSDMSCCEMVFINPEGKESGYGRNPIIDESEFTKEKKKKFLSNYVSYFTTFIYSRELILKNGIRFSDEFSSEDSFFLACALLYCEKISQVNRPLYFYHRHSLSLTMRYDEKRYLRKLTSFGKLISFSKTRGLYDIYKPELDFIYIKKAFLISELDYITNADKANRKIVKLMFNELQNTIPDYSDCEYLKKKPQLKLLTLLIGLSPRLAIFILPCLVKIFKIRF